MRRAFIFLATLTLFGCKNTWNEDDKDAWQQACTENAMKWAGTEQKAKTYCECVLDKMMLKYPNENDALEHIAELATDSSIQSCKPQDTTTINP